MTSTVVKNPYFLSGQYTRDITVEVKIDETRPERVLKIGSGLSAELRDELVRFLSRNKDFFAWAAADIPGIDPAVISQELQIRLNH